MAMALSSTILRSHINCIFGHSLRTAKVPLFTALTCIIRSGTCLRSRYTTVFSCPTNFGPKGIVTRFCTKSQRPYEVDTNVTKNVLIYSNKKGGFYKLFTYFGFAQFIFWGYLSYFVFTRAKDEETPKVVKEISWMHGINAMQMKYKNGLSLLFFIIGYGVLNLCIIYPLRAVKQLWLLRGGEQVGFVTFGTFGKSRSFQIPVKHINCLKTRTESGTQIPLKLKGRQLFFLMDKSGTFHNTKLFDYSVGLHRKWK